MTAPLGALARTSTAKQSVASQEAKIRAWAGDRALSWYVEDDTSGKLTIKDRPELARLFDDLRAERISGIVVTENSRLGRDAWATLARIGECRELGAEVWVLDMDERAPLDLEDPVVFLRLAAAGFTSAMERLGIGKRTKAGLNGWDLAGVAVPEGTPGARRVAVRSRKPVGRARAIVCPTLLAQARARHESGVSLRQMVAEKTVLGVIRRKGEEVPWVVGLNALCAALRQA